MTKFLSLLLLFAIGGSLSAQIQLTSAYFPVAGDTLKSNTADSLSTASVEVGPAGADQAWNFGFPTVRDEGAEPVTAVEGDSIFPTANLKVQTTANTESFYAVSETEFNLVGLNTSLSVLPDFVFTAPVLPVRPVRRAPLNYLDEFTSVTSNSFTVSPDSIPEEAFELIGESLNDVDSLRITTTSSRDDVVDAWGTARLGDNFYRVLREKRTENVFVKLEVKAGLLPFIDVTATITLVSEDLAEFIGQQPVTVTYLYWSPESIEPIAEIATGAASGRPFNFNFKRIETATSTERPGISQATLKAFPNPATDLVTFDISGLDRGRYTLSLKNTLGQTLKNRDFTPLSGQTRLQLDVSTYPSGLYLYSLRNERGRVMATRKLYVR